MKVLRNKKWTNWAKSVHCKANIWYPETQEDIISLVKQSAENGENIRVVGSGHSFPALVATNNNIISLDNYSGVESIQKDTHQALVKSGTKLWQLGKLLADEQLSMINLGDIDSQSIAGVVGTGTHGTGAKLGSISTQVKEIELVTGSGEVVVCSDDEKPEVFKAAQVAMGSLGIMSRLKLQLRPLYYLKVQKQKFPFEEALNQLDENVARYRHYEIFWIPHTDVVYTKSLDIAEEQKTSGMIQKYIKDVVLENVFLWSLGLVSRVIPSSYKSLAKVSAALIPEGEETNQSHRVFTSRRWVRFNEMEYAVPIENGAAALREIRDWIREKRIRVSFPIEFRFVQEDDIYLSPAYGKSVAYIAIHNFRNLPYQDYFDGCEAILRKWGGRPHWGKLHSLTAKELRPLYPKWDEFHAIRKELDPKGVFMNDYLKGLFERD